MFVRSSNFDSAGIIDFSRIVYSSSALILSSRPYIFSIFLSLSSFSVYFLCSSLKSSISVISFLPAFKSDHFAYTSSPVILADTKWSKEP